jgi:hypothetical protein
MEQVTNRKDNVADHNPDEIRAGESFHDTPTGDWTADIVATRLYILTSGRQVAIRVVGCATRILSAHLTRHDGNRPRRQLSVSSSVSFLR